MCPRHRPKYIHIRNIPVEYKKDRDTRKDNEKPYDHRLKGLDKTLPSQNKSINKTVQIVLYMSIMALNKL